MKLDTKRGEIERLTNLGVPQTRIAQQLNVTVNQLRYYLAQKPLKVVSNGNT